MFGTELGERCFSAQLSIRRAIDDAMIRGATLDQANDMARSSIRQLIEPFCISLAPGERETIEEESIKCLDAHDRRLQATVDREAACARLEMLTRAMTPMLNNRDPQAGRRKLEERWTPTMFRVEINPTAQSETVGDPAARERSPSDADTTAADDAMQGVRMTVTTNTIRKRKRLSAPARKAPIAKKTTCELATVDILENLELVHRIRLDFVLGSITEHVKKLVENLPNDPDTGKKLLATMRSTLNPNPTTQVGGNPTSVAPQTGAPDLSTTNLGNAPMNPDIARKVLDQVFETRVHGGVQKESDFEAGRELASMLGSYFHYFSTRWLRTVLKNPKRCDELAKIVKGDDEGAGPFSQVFNAYKASSKACRA